MTEPTTPLGVIVDTNSGGRFDLIMYEDGILGVKGTYVGVALRAGGAGMVGGGGSGLSGAAAAGAGSASAMSRWGPEPTSHARRIARVENSNNARQDPPDC